jgi:hypothetical protein
VSPGTYLRLRRQTAGHTIRQMAQLYAYSPLGAPAAEQLFAEAEADQVQLGEGVIRRLAQHLALDPGVYLRLADSFPPPPICRQCGCSWEMACPGGCAWADEAGTLCTACAPSTTSVPAPEPQEEA